MKFPVEFEREDEGTGLEVADSGVGHNEGRLPASSGIMFPLRLQSPFIMQVWAGVKKMDVQLTSP